MSVIEKVSDALKEIAAEADDDQAVEALIALLPAETYDRARPMIVGLVAARKSWIHYDDSQRRMSETISEIESDPEDQRGMWLSSWETDVDRALDGRDRAAESIKRLLAGLAELLGEEPPTDQPKPDDAAFSVEAPVTDNWFAQPQGCDAILLALATPLMVMGVLGLVWVITLWLGPIFIRP